MKPKPLIWAFLLLCACTFHAAAQTLNVVGFYRPAMIKCKDPLPDLNGQKLIIPFVKLGNLILVEADVDGQTGYFILDTGAPYLVLNATYFRDYPQTALYAALGVGNQTTEIFRTEVDSLHIRSLGYANVEADVADLSHLENSRGMKILGLLGCNLFKQFVVGIDFIASNLTIYTEDYFEKFDDPTSYNTIPFDLKNNTMAVQAEINGQPLTFVFDTGAEVNVLDNDLDDAVYEKFIIQNRSRLAGSVGEEIDVFSGLLLATSVGGLDFFQMQTIMTNLSGIGKVYGYAVDGILGYEFMKKAPIFINFPENKIYLSKLKYYE